MAPLTEKQKDRWLDLVTKGMDRIEAAHAVGEAPSTFQILSLEDLDFRDRMKLALTEGWRNRKIYSAALTTKEVRDEFLELVRSGKMPVEAAHAVGGTYKDFAKLVNVTGFYYDKEFHVAYVAAMNEGHESFQNRIRNLQITAAEGGEYRAIRDLVIQYLPEGEKLSAKKIEVRDGDLEALKQAALGIDRSQLTDDELAELIRLHEKASKQPQLISGN